MASAPAISQVHSSLWAEPLASKAVYNAQARVSPSPYGGPVVDQHILPWPHVPVGPFFFAAIQSASERRHRR